MKTKTTIMAIALMTVLITGFSGFAFADDEERKPEPRTKSNSSSDNSAAPSMSGWNHNDKERVTFEGLYREPVFLMTTTTINIIQGHASEQFVKVFFDGELIETIDIGATPLGIPHHYWLGFQAYVEIPFEAYYEMTDEGELLSHGRGNQNVMLDGEGNKIFLDNEGDVIER